MNGMHKITIRSDENNQILKHIFIDDQEIFGVTAADLKLRPDEIPVINLEILATDVEVDGINCETFTKIIYKSQLLNIPISAVNFSNRAYNALRRAHVFGEDWSERDNIETIGDVLRCYLNGRVKKYDGVGRKTMTEIKEKLTKLGLIGGDKH